MNNEISDLIGRLERLHIERQALLRQEQEITERLREATDTRRDTGAGGAVQPGRVSPTPAAPGQGRFQVGDRVFIQNRIRHVPRERNANPGDRAAIVQRASRHRVDITTYNGLSTWRRPENLRYLRAEEHLNIIQGHY